MLVQNYDDGELEAAPLAYVDMWELNQRHDLV